MCFRSRVLSGLSALVLLVPVAMSTGAAVGAPTISVQRVTAGLDIPWDVTWVGRLMLFDERSGTIWSKREGQAARRVQMSLSVFAQGEAGLMGIVADPAASSNKYFYTCAAVATSGGAPADVQVVKWRLSNDTKAVKVKTLIKGIPLDQWGRHTGCRLVFRSARHLYVGTGDAGDGVTPQNLKSLGGKVLRVRSDGYIPRTNPFYSRGGNARYVWNYGHRNVQGLAKRPGSSQLWSVEHGPDRDDEVNLVVKGGNYGWNPVPGYNEDASMTDRDRYPKAIAAKWSSGSPTVATSGAAFLSGRKWGSWNGLLAVAMLKGQGILLFKVDSKNRLTRVSEIANTYGRIRTVRQGPDGALYFTTSNGTDDAIYRIVAR